ncbi:hypothetical protein ACUNWD_18915 [Sunxiuqinia sp. A32]|uniref:hypothetical protein n=1 Tax=Sunxiuqinia sp. A32 TaxID=3461496 RepID=UPI00404684E6
MRYILLSLLLFVSLISFSQKLEYDVLFQGIGDNREFSSGYANSQTILGERTSMEFGTTLDGNHQFRIGISHLFEFGSELDYNKPQLTAYYHFTDTKTDFYFGAFPRMEILNFPLSMLTDTIQYYRPNIEGMYGKYSWDWGYQAGFVDWTGRQTETVRESFFAGFLGRMDVEPLFFENYLIMYHYAHALEHGPEVHIQDNAAMAFYLGTDLTKLIPIEKAYVKAGTLGSLFRERSVTDGYLKAWSFVGELYGEIKNFALRTTWHQGQGHHITNGDRFYDLDSYIRTDLYWKFLNTDHLQGKFNLSFHLVDGSDIDQSQQLSLIYRFGN